MTDEAKAAAWDKFVYACEEFVAGEGSAEQDRALSDAACEYAGHCVTETYERCAVVAEGERFLGGEWGVSAEYRRGYNHGSEDIAEAIREAAKTYAGEGTVIGPASAHSEGSATLREQARAIDRAQRGGE